MKYWIGIITLCVCTRMQAAILFQDTFETADSQNINGNYVDRQLGGKIVADYTGGLSAYKISGGKLVQEGRGEITLNNNLADSIAGGDFEISFKMSMNDAPEKYVSVFLTGRNENTRETSRIGFHFWGSRKDPAAAMITIYGGTAVAGARGAAFSLGQALNKRWKMIFGENFDITKEHFYQLISHDGGDVDSYDFIIDGVEIKKGMKYTFSEDTLRTLNLCTTALASEGGGATFDDLTITCGH